MSTDHLILLSILGVYLAFLSLIIPGYLRARKGDSSHPVVPASPPARDPALLLSLPVFVVLNAILYLGLRDWAVGWSVWRQLVVLLILGVPLYLSSYIIAAWIVVLLRPNR